MGSSFLGTSKPVCLLSHAIDAKLSGEVLNLGTHGGDPPLYEHEVQKALDLLGKVDKCLA